MAVKATSQVDIVDLTDGFSVILSAESITVPGNSTGAAIAETNAFTITVTALQGSTKVPCTVVVTPSTGISAGSQSTSGNVVSIPFSVTSSLVDKGTITIAVTITGKSVTITKTVGVSVAKTGAKGDTPVITATKSGTKTKILADGTEIAEISDGTNGTNGTNGLNQATVYLYKRDASASKPSSGTSTYTFSTGVLSNVPSGWSQTFPAETQERTTPVWMMVAVASSNTATDTISYSEWSTPVKMVSSGSNGTDGDPGSNGYNQATVFLYKRAASAPSSVTSSAVTYTFSTGALSTTPSGWSRSVPTGTNPCYVAQAVAVSQDDTYSIAANAWTTPTKLVEDGADGNDGEDALVLVIDSSAGTIFKNTSAATTLTAQVFKGGVQLTETQINALGTVKWYKDGGTTAVGTGITYAISAGNVTNKATFTASLEA